MRLLLSLLLLSSSHFAFSSSPLQPEQPSFVHEGTLQLYINNIELPGSSIRYNLQLSLANYANTGVLDVVNVTEINSKQTILSDVDQLLGAAYFDANHTRLTVPYLLNYEPQNPQGKNLNSGNPEYPAFYKDIQLLYNGAMGFTFLGGSEFGACSYGPGDGEFSNTFGFVCTNDDVQIIITFRNHIDDYLALGEGITDYYIDLGDSSNRVRRYQARVQNNGSTSRLTYSATNSGIVIRNASIDANGYLNVSEHYDDATGRIKTLEYSTGLNGSQTSSCTYPNVSNGSSAYIESCRLLDANGKLMRTTQGQSEGPGKGLLQIEQIDYSKDGSVICKYTATSQTQGTLTSPLPGVVNSADCYDNWAAEWRL